MEWNGMPYQCIIVSIRLHTRIIIIFIIIILVSIGNDLTFQFNILPSWIPPLSFSLSLSLFLFLF